MKVSDIILNSHFQLLNQPSTLDTEVSQLVSCDLMSHVMANADEHDALITVLNNINTLGVASLHDFSCVIYSSNITVNTDIIKKANDLDIPIIKSSLPSAETVITLHKMGF